MRRRRNPGKRPVSYFLVKALVMHLKEACDAERVHCVYHGYSLSYADEPHHTLHEELYIPNKGRGTTYSSEPPPTSHQGRQRPGLPIPKFLINFR